MSIAVSRERAGATACALRCSCDFAAVSATYTEATGSNGRTRNADHDVELSSSVRAILIRRDASKCRCSEGHDHISSPC